MAFADPASGPRARPSTVNLAVYLLYAAAGLELINIIISLVYSSALVEGAKKAVAGTSQEGAGFGQGATGIITVVIGALIIVLLVLLAVYVGKGKQVARILTWVLGGIAACCTLAAFASSVLVKSSWEQLRKDEPTLPTWDRYNELLYSEVPGWYQPVTTVLGVLLVLAILGAIVLLALPASHPYFRKVEQQWEPPVPGAGGDPGYPGYPARRRSAERAATDGVNHGRPRGTGAFRMRCRYIGAHDRTASRTHHRRHRRHRRRVRARTRRSGIRPGAGGPRSDPPRGNGGGGGHRGGWRRGAARGPVHAGGVRPGRDPARRHRPPGGPAGQQRRDEPQHAVPALHCGAGGAAAAAQRQRGHAAHARGTARR